MKRIWIAGGILALILGGTLWHSFYIKGLTHDLTCLLEAADAEAEKGDWDGAMELTRTARQKWEKRDGYLHVTLRHDQNDAIYVGFQEVEQFIRCRESEEYAAANARLMANLTLLSEAEQLTVKNIL